MEILEYINNWFLSNCNGDWEHVNQIKIQTVSNPGWYIEIDLLGTKFENITLNTDLVEIDENNWYFYDIENGKFKASGDIKKLVFLLEKFKQIVIIG